jgi:hypothetical protein
MADDEVPVRGHDDAAYFAEDARDRRAALAFAQAFVYGNPRRDEFEWPPLADEAYRWLQRRDSLRAVSVEIIPGQPITEGTTAMATTFDLSDTDEVTFSLQGADAKGAEVPLDSGFTAAWSLADPDSTGAVLTVSADTTTATVAAGVPDTNLMLSVVVTNPDGSTLNGAEAIVVQATAATTVSLVPGTPVAE